MLIDRSGSIEPVFQKISRQHEAHGVTGNVIGKRVFSYQSPHARELDRRGGSNTLMSSLLEAAGNSRAKG